MAGEDDHLVASILQADGGIDNETLSTTDAEVRVKEDDGPLIVVFLRHGRDSSLAGIRGQAEGGKKFPILFGCLFAFLSCKRTEVRLVRRGRSDLTLEPAGTTEWELRRGSSQQGSWNWGSSVNGRC